MTTAPRPIPDPPADPNAVGSGCLVLLLLMAPVWAGLATWVFGSGRTAAVSLLFTVPPCWGGAVVVAARLRAIRERDAARWN